MSKKKKDNGLVRYKSYDDFKKQQIKKDTVRYDSFDDYKKQRDEKKKQEQLEEQRKQQEEARKQQEEAARKARIYNRVGTDTVLEAGNKINSGVNRMKREDFIRDKLGIKPKVQAEPSKRISGLVSKADSAVSGQAKREQSISEKLADKPKAQQDLRTGIRSIVSKSGEISGGQEKRERSIIDKLGQQNIQEKNPVKPMGVKENRSFLEWSEDQARNNTNSRLNQAARRRIMDDLNTSNQAKNLDKILNPISEEGKGSWLGRQTEEYQNAMALGNAQKNIQVIENLRRRGYLNNTGDVNNFDREKMAIEKIKLNRKKADLDQKIAGYDEELSKYDGRTQQMPDGLQLIMKLGSEEDRRQIENERTILRRYPADSAEYQNAQATLDEIAQKGNQLAQKYLNLNDEYQTMGVMRWTNERLYDAINGDGSYLQVVSEMSLEEKNEFDRAIEEVLPSVERLNKEKDWALNQLGDLNDQISRIGKEQEERSRYVELMGTAANGSTKYNDEYYTYQPNTWRRDADNFVNYQTDDIHRIVSFINGGQEYRMWAEGTNGQISNDYSGAMAMMPAEKEKLTALYNQAMQQGKEPTEAKAFFDGLQPYLNERYRRYEELRNQYTARTIPVLSSVADTVMAMTQPFEAIRTGIGLATGQGWAKDPNSWNFANTRAINDIENQVSKDLGDVGGFIYKGAMSGVKNFARGLMAMGTGGAAEAVTLAQFFGENFMSSYQNALEETQDENYAAKSALVDSAISTFFEVASVEALFGDPKNFVLYMLKNTGAEMSEEYFEAEFGPYIERALMGRSKWDKREGQILNNGGYYDENNKWVSVTEKNAEEAAAQARREQNREKWEAVGSAAISMIGPAGFGAVRNVMETQQIGQAALQGKSAATMQKEEMQELLRKNALTMIESGTQMPEGSESRKKAEDLQKELDSGKRFSKLKYGELVKTIVSETNEQMGKIATEVLQKNIEQDLKDAGAKNPEKMAEIVAKRVTGQELSMPERFALSRSEEGKKAAIEYGYQLPTGRVAEARNEITEKTAETRSIQENIRDLLTTEADREKAVGDVEQMMQGAQTAGNITRLLTGTKDSTKVEYDGEVLDVTGFTTGTAEGENGKKEKRIFVQLSNGQEADISEVRGMNENAAKVLRYIELDGNRMGSNRVANILLQHANDTKDAASMVYDAMKVRINTVLGLNVPRTSGLSAEMTEEIRQAAMEDFEEAENERIQNRRQINPGKGRTVYNGVVYGTNAFTEAIKRLNRTQRNEAFAIGVIAKAAGLDVELYNDPQNTKEQGSYTAAGGIRINLAGTFNEEGWHRGALATFAHEITHQLEGNSREAYAQLRQFVINNLQKNGENVEERLRGIMDTYAKNGQDLDLNGAVAELVAKSSEQVLTDENVIRSLRESDPNLYGRIRKVVSNLVDRIRTAIGMAKETSSYYSKALGNVADDLSRLWLGAYQEAKQVQETVAKTKEQFSKQMDDGYDYTKAFGEQVSDSVNGLLPQNDSVLVGDTPQIYVEIGFPYLPSVINQEHVGYAIKGNYPKLKYREGHVFSEEEYAKLPEKLAHPIAIIKDPSSTKEVISYIEMVNTTGKPVIVPYRMGAENMVGGKRIDVNRLKTVYADDDGIAVLQGALKKHTAEKPTVYYLDKEKVLNYPLNHDTITIVSSGPSGLISRIPESNRVVKEQLKHQDRTEEVLEKYNIKNDKEYMQAVKNGDMGVAQQYVDTVAEDKGFTEKVYHGTPTGGFTVFKDWSYFTKSKEYADRYQNASASSVRGSYETTNPQTYELYMNPGKVFDTRKPAMAKLFNEARAEYGLTALENTNTGLPDWTDGRDLIEFIEDRGLDYDTILLDEGADGGYGEPVVSRGISYVSRNNRVKSAETVTYDKDGNVIPPSERFNIKQNDIRFSMQEPVEVNRDGLIAVHNLTEQNLLDTLKEGGFTAPSIAIVRAAMGHSKFGDISAVFKPSAIDPMQNSRNKVYGQDAWTPTRSNAEIQYELNGDEMYKARDYIIEKLKDVDPLIRTAYQQWVNQNIYEEFTNKSIYDWLLEARENPGMLAAYAIDKGGKVENKYRKERINWGIYPEHEQMYRDFLETLDNLDMLDQFMEDMKTKPAALNLEKWGNVFGESSEKAKKYMDAYQKAEDAGKMTSMKREMLWSKIREAWEYQKDGREIKTQDKLDIYDTAAALSEKIDKNDFDKWFLDLYKKAFGKKGVRNDKDLFTSIGDRRPFSQTHWDATTENIVRAMYANHPSKGGEAGGATGLMAKASKEYRNLDEIRADAGRLQMLDEKEYEQKINELDQKIIEFCQRAWDATGWNTSNIKEVLIEAGEAYAKNPTAATIKKALAKNGLKLPDNLVTEAKQLMDEAREIPTGYFEAKPERVNTFDELETIIVPADVKQIVFDEMDRQGVPYVTYDGTEADRLRVLNEQENAKFSFQDEMEQDVGHWMMTVKEDSLQTEAEKQMLKKYKDLRMRLDLREMRKSELRNKIAPIEMIPEAQRTEDQKRQLKKLNDQLGHTQRVIDDTLEELARASSAEGFARMMYQESKVLNNFIYGRTQAEVRDAVEAMEKNAGAIAQRIAENREAIRELEKKDVVQAVKKVLGRTTVEQAAADLKKAYNSTWTKSEILNYLNPIVLKMTQGEDISYDVEELAGILIDSDRTNIYEGLSALRGLTITLGKGQQQELKASNSSLKEIRRRLAGTGIQVKYGDRSTLEADIEDLRAEYPEMPDFGNEKDSLENFVSWVEGMKRSGADQFYDQKLAEAMATIMQKAASAMNGIYMPTESKAQKQVLALVEYIKTLNAKTEKLEKNLNDIAADMEKMQKAGANATSMVNVLHRDVNIAIDYYNKMAKIAEDNAKQQKQNKIIEQLKSKHAQKILKNNEEWRNLIERDKQARAQAEDNRTTRNKINTVVKRMYNLLKNPQGQKNIPEHMQGLARYLIGMIVDNDMDGRKISNISRTNLEEAKRVLDAWNTQNASFNITDLEAMEDYGDARHIISNDLYVIDEDLKKYNREINGKNKLDTLKQRGQILKEIQEAVSEIYSWIQAEREIAVRDRKILVADAAQDVVDGTEGKKFKEWTGKAGRSLAALHKFIVSGNMTPEYFFRTLGNKGLSELWETYHDAENRNGLELKRAQEKLAAIAEEYGYKNWDTKKKMEIQLSSGKVNMDLGQLMSLWATWKREQTLGPEMSHHLQDGGFYVEEQDLREGLLGKTELDKKAHRVTEADMGKIGQILTDEQKQYVDAVVQYMSNDMSKLGNEASMKAYGINMYKEKYYFPFQIWEGVKSRKSNDAGKGASGNQAFHPSFATLRKNGANNAIILGDFTQTAADHIAGMINYATMGLANENLNKVLNFQVQEGWNPNESTKRNIRAIIDEAYGQEALDYLMKLKVQLEGGAVKLEKTFYDKLISLFRKNAVAGSLSVAMQQPLSYIRAAMMVNPKYLTEAIMKEYWKGSYKELLKHSGVAVIKDMGRFDMNFGQSAREFLMPDARETNLKKTWEFVKEKSTILPELFDRWTWTRMWVAVKAEQHALHPEMDMKSDEFLDLCGERFNDVMRRTQVYDSVLVKSANMRSQDKWMKSLTSFMAEPTLTINVLADAVRQVKTGEVKGLDAVNLISKTGATFLLSAALQAAIKAIMSSGRSPDEKKTWMENFMNRLGSNLLSEADPLQLIPGYSDAITVLKKGKLEDDAMGAVGKLITAGRTGFDLIRGKETEDLYRTLEDSAGQITQIISGVPAKNIMRDLRAMYNWFIGKPYADRETSMNVLKYQQIDAFNSADNLWGVLNGWLGEAGYDTSTTGYYKRVYNAIKEGNKEEETGLIDYLLNGKGIKEMKTITSGVQGLIKKDYANGGIKRNRAEELLRINKPEIKDRDLFETLDEIDYEKETGEDISNYSAYRPIYDAIDKNDSEKFAERKEYMIENGYKESDINTQVRSYIKGMYEEGTADRKEAESMLKKYIPDIKEKEVTKTLDEIDYEKKTGKSVDSYSMYTPVYDAIDSGNEKDLKEARNYLLKNGYEEKDIDSQIKSHITGQYKDGEISKADAESKLKKYAKSMKANDIWFTLDKIDYQKAGGKDESDKYYRLYDAIKNNKVDEIREAVKLMTAHGMETKNIKKQIGQKYKAVYLAATGSEKRTLKDALTKAYKAVGMTEADAIKLINSWK